MTKKFFAGLLGLSLCLILGGCDTASQPDDSATPTPSPTISAPAPTGSERPTPSLPTPEPTPSTLPERTDLNFRTAKWGDSMDVVKAYETAEFYKVIDDKALVYKGSVAGLDAGINYFFDPEYGFYMGAYRLTDEHSTGSGYITDFNTLKAAVIEKYGEPTTDDIINISSLAEEHEAGDAFWLGYTVYSATWDLDDFRITMGMTCDNGEVTCGLFYATNDFTPDTNTDGI